ncbi:MAG: helix-turn-helix domain-containing protein [Fimbriimonadaceae bacterium]|nr:helix-turn-helix domain-containing protein [Fimbriimonadaceae bacterium]
MVQQRSFGEELRLLARRRYASLAAFSAVAGLSPGRISQIVKGTYPNLSYQTLETLLRAFPDIAEKEALYQAWIRDYAPSPIETELPTAGATDDEIWGFLECRNSLYELGKIGNVRDATGSLWHELAHQPSRQELAYHCGKIHVETSSHTERHRQAIHVSRELQNLATSAYEPAWVASALWQEAISTYPVDPDSPRYSRSAMSRLGRYLSDWQPRTDRERSLHRTLFQTYLRDRLIALEELYRHGVRNRSLLEYQLAALQSVLPEIEIGVDFKGTKEVEARALIALGRLDEASDALEAAAQPGDTYNSLKVAVTTARLHVADKDADGAFQILAQWVPIAETQSLYHYRSQLVSIEQSLLQAYQRLPLAERVERNASDIES